MMLKKSHFRDVTLSERGKVARRTFLGRVLGFMGGVIAAVLGVPLLGFAASPALQEEEQSWREIGKVADVKVGVPTRLKYRFVKKQGWYESEVDMTAWVVTPDGKDFTVFHPACTHLGCAYSWMPDKNHFLCPCHTGIFGIDGRVISGPPPRPLDRYEVKIENGKILIGKLHSGSEFA